MQSNKTSKLWFWPFLIGSASLFGLVIALIYDGLYEVIGAVLLMLVGCFCIYLINKTWQ